MARSRRSRERLSAAEARRVALAAQGFADGRAGRSRTAARCARVLGQRRPAPDRLGQRPRARPLPAAVRAARAVPARARRPRGVVRAAAAVRVLGSRGVAAARWPRSRCCAGACSAPHDDAWGGMRRVAQRAPGAGASAVLGEVAERGPIAASELEEERPRRGRSRGGAGRTPSARSSSCSGPGQITSARRRRLRAPLRPARAGAAARGGRRADARAGGRPARAGPDRGALARRGRRARPARLLPAAAGRDARRAWPSWWRPASCCRWRSRAGARRPTSGTETSVPRRVRRPRPDRPVRLADLGALARGAAVRLPLPDRDLRARRPSGCTATTCCRSCSATGWSRGWTSRPTARPACCACRPRTPEPDAPREDRGRAGGGAAPDGRLARASSESRSVTAATWRRRSSGMPISAGVRGREPPAAIEAPLEMHAAHQVRHRHGLGRHLVVPVLLGGRQPACRPWLARPSRPSSPGTGCRRC